MKKLHLDSEYRNRWEEFCLSDGTVEDSRLKNWREVAWNRVTKVTVHILEQVHTVDNSGQSFLAFMNFRWGGHEAIFSDDGQYVGHMPIKIWTIGWTDGKECFLKDIDFYAGNLIKDYVAPLSQFACHLHPAVKDKVLAR